MADNIKVPASKIPKSKKILLYPGDPLIGVLSPDTYVIVNKGSLEPVQSIGVDNGYNPDDPTVPDDPFPPEDPPEDPRKAPRLEDITLISKTMVTDGNGNQFVEFKFNVKNSVGTEVVGVHGYGQ